MGPLPRWGPSEPGTEPLGRCGPTPPWRGWCWLPRKGGLSLSKRHLHPLTGAPPGPGAPGIAAWACARRGHSSSPGSGKSRGLILCLFTPQPPAQRLAGAPAGLLARGAQSVSAYVGQASLQLPCQRPGDSPHKPPPPPRPAPGETQAHSEPVLCPGAAGGPGPDPASLPSDPVLGSACASDRWPWLPGVHCIWSLAGPLRPSPPQPPARARPPGSGSPRLARRARGWPPAVLSSSGLVSVTASLHPQHHAGGHLFCHVSPERLWESRSGFC